MEAFPKIVPKTIEQRKVTRVWCERKGALLLHQTRADAKRLANLHELPTPAQAGLGEADALRGKLLAKRKRSITRFQITESIHVANVPPGRLGPGLIFVPLAKLNGLTLSGPHRRWVAEILAR